MSFVTLKIFILSSLFLVVIQPFSNESELGGIQLLMSLEQQKRTERLVDGLVQDLSIFYDKIDAEIFYYNWRNAKKRKIDITLTKEEKQSIFENAENVNQLLNEFTDEFKSIYFRYGGDEYSRQYFEPFIAFKSNIENMDERFEDDYLFIIHEQTQVALRSLEQVKNFVQEARIANAEELKEKAKEMSVWEWLFGY